MHHKLVTAAEESSRSIKRFADRLRSRKYSIWFPKALEGASDRLSRSVYEYKRRLGDRELSMLLYSAGNAVGHVKRIAKALRDDGLTDEADTLESICLRLSYASFEATATTQPISVDDVMGRARDDEEA